MQQSWTTPGHPGGTREAEVRKVIDAQYLRKAVLARPRLVKKDPHHRRGSFSFPPGILAPTGQIQTTAALRRTHAKCPDLTRVPSV
jgi:hypothetical protein